jgi:hypothetical protein
MRHALVFGDFDRAHASRASWAYGDVDDENTLEEPGPRCLEDSGGGAKYPSLHPA